MITPMHTELLETRCTIGALGQRLGAYLHIGNIGALRPDGRRKADQAPHTHSKGTLGAHLARIRKNHALKTHAYERSMTRAVNPDLPDWVRKSAEKHAGLIETQQAHNLKKALTHINIKDGKINSKDVPWLLAYAEMLDGDEGVEDVELDEYDA